MQNPAMRHMHTAKHAKLPHAQRCIIFAAGEYYEEMPYITADSFVIAADGGVDHVLGLGLNPNVVIGDNDSTLSTLPEDLRDRVVTLPSQKDDTDLTAAMKLGWAQGIRQFEIYGALGGRIDHTIAAMQLTARAAHHGGIAFLHGNNTIITAITNATMTFPAGYVAARRMISVYSHSNQSINVSIQGLKYEVEGATLTNDNPLGTSNEFLADTTATISVEEGTLLITYPTEAPTPTVMTSIESDDNFGEIDTNPSELLSPRFL